MPSKKNKKITVEHLDGNKSVVVFENGPTEVLQMKPAADVLDMKLTRSELIDLITEEVEADLRSQQESLIKEIKEVNNNIVKYFSDMSDDDIINNFFLPEARKVLKTSRKELKEDTRDIRSFLDYRHYHQNHNTKISLGSVYVQVEIPNEFTKKLSELNKKLYESQQKSQKLSSKTGKLEIMKQMLSSSEEGKKLLEQIQSFKKNTATKLLAK